MKTLFLTSILLTLSFCSVINEQKSLAVTIYNNDFAMVKDIRSISFDQGNSYLYFTDVSSNIQTQTVTFKPLSTKTNIRIYEQNFENNLVNKDSLLQKFIEKEIKLYVRLGDSPKKVYGTLLSYGDGYILKTATGINVYNNIDSIEFPKLPEGFFTMPTLNWKVFSEQQTKVDCEVAYRTTGFGWKADYAITLDEGQKMADFGGWVTIDNYSGKKYVEAKLKLIAGDINTVTQTTTSQVKYKNVDMMRMNALPMAPQFTEKSFSDYHMYTLSQPVTLNESSQKQVEFIPKVYNVAVRKYHLLSINVGGTQMKNIRPVNKIQFKNKKSLGLGIPLPKGTIRVFKRDTTDDSVQFIGEDQIDHTPKDEKITITTGTAFDVIANINVESRETFQQNGYNARMNMKITNHKDIPVEVEIVINNFYGDNLQIKWKGKTQLLKSSANQYKANVKIIGPNETWTAKWEESYRP